MTQKHPRFRAPYSGTNSLDAERSTKETSDLTLFLGVRPWKNTEFWINPEIDQGFGLSSTVGVAGFPSGEAYKVGANAPYLRIPRVFVRHFIALPGTDQAFESATNQFADSRPADGITLTAGKFSVVDVFDGNAYAHDPRNDFMNWSIIDAGPFDYAADAWGFTYGAAAEWTQSAWTTRLGFFQLSRVPNGKVVNVDFRNHATVLEIERRVRLLGQPGKIKLLGFVNHARMARYDDAVRRADETGTGPDVASVRRSTSRGGVTVNVEQEVLPALGVFARVGVNDGRKEAYEFTEINRSATLGFALKGTQWGRRDDTVGVAAVVNGLSGPARRYFAAGGIGILIGDGRLNYGTEQIVEAYYSLRLVRSAALSLDYQHVGHPAYNRDRGPVSIYGVRLHADF